MSVRAVGPHEHEARHNIVEGMHHAGQGRHDQAIHHLNLARTHAAAHLNGMKRSGAHPDDVATEARAWEIVASILEKKIAGGLLKKAGEADQKTVVSPMKPAGIHPDWNRSVTNVAGKTSINFHHKGTLGTVSIVPHESGTGYDVRHAGRPAAMKGVQGPFPTAMNALQHAKGYLGAVSAGTTAAPKMHDMASGQAGGLQRPTAPSAPSMPKAPSAAMRVGPSKAAV